MKAIGAAISICLLVAPSLHASRLRQSGVLRKISKTAQKLRKLQPPEPDAAYRPPPRVKPLLAELRRDVRDLVSDTLAASPPASTDPTRVQTEILKRLQEAGVGLPGPLPDRKFGTVDITIERPSGHCDLLVAVTKLGVPCSLDNSLYVFGQDRGGWNLVLSLEAQDYSKRYKYLRKRKWLPLQGALTYAISPPDKAGNWFLVAASVAEWCKYDLRGLKFEVVRPGPSPTSPKILLDWVAGFWIPGGGPLLAVSSDRFRKQACGEADPQ